MRWQLQQSRASRASEIVASVVTARSVSQVERQLMAVSFRRRCTPSRFAVVCLGAFIVILMFQIMNTLHECNDEELIATKSLLQKYSMQVQDQKNKISYLKVALEKTEIKLKKKSNLSAQSIEPGLPIIYIITPTYTRLEQKAELTRISHTLRLVKNVYWIIIEDSEFKTNLVSKFLKNCDLQYTHLNVLTPTKFKMNSSDPHWLKPRGVLQRNAGLNWLRTDPYPAKHGGVLYFGDDDNTYSLQVFDEMRFTKKVSVWPVGLAGYLRYESPIVQNRKVVGWYTYWKPSRPFAIDMAGFAVNLKLVLDHPEAAFSNSVQRGYQESTFISSLGVTMDDMEPKANLCTKVLVWHTRTEKTNTKNEDKMQKKYGSGTDLTIEV